MGARAGHRNLPDRPHARPHHCWRGVAHVLAQLRHDGVRVVSIGDDHQHLHFQQLDVRGVAVAGKEGLEIPCKEPWSMLGERLEVQQHDVRDFWGPGHESEEGRSDALQDLLVDLFHAERHAQEDLRRGQHHSRIRVLQAVFQDVHDVENLIFIRRRVPQQEFQKEALCPFAEGLQLVQQAVNQSPGRDQVLAPDGLQSVHAVHHHVRLGVPSQHGLQFGDHVGLLQETRVLPLHLEEPHHRVLPHVPVGILQAFRQHRRRVLHQVGDAQLAQVPHSEPTDGGIRVRCVLHEGVHCQQHQLLLGPGVGADVQVEELLQGDVFLRGGQDHL
mmetsp:Transcript_29088/g.81408  ORF Transcript_29088/g.81408 Transcript_29088/m.81408 type:complete len:330 (+) Transcript_29088:1090-2079(+)